MDQMITIFALAFLAESFTEFCFSQWTGQWTKYVAMGVGVLLAVNFQVDVFATYFDLSSFIPYAGIVLTGLLLGRGSNWFHDFFDKYVNPETA